MSTSPNTLVTGARGRVGQAIQLTLGGEWDLGRYSRTACPDENIRSLDALLVEEGLATLGGADLLIHAAWSCVPASAEEHPELMSQQDFPLLDRLITQLQATQRTSRPPLLVFISTGAVYGPAPGRPNVETDTPQPLGAYARGKLEAEQRLLASGLPVCILRVGNLYGLPSKPNDRQGVLARLVRYALAEQPFSRWGEDSVKDYLHSDDFFAALRIIQSRHLQGIWNIGSGQPTALSTLIARVQEKTGKPVAVVPHAAPAWDVQDNRLSIAKFTETTGWQPRVTLEEGIQREIDALRGQV